MRHFNGLVRRNDINKSKTRVDMTSGTLTHTTSRWQSAEPRPDFTQQQNGTVKKLVAGN